MHRLIAVSATFASCAMASPALASVLTYQPGLGTLPQAQGWTYGGSYNAPASVSGGQLTYGPTTVGGTTFWEHEPTTPITFATQTVFIEATIRLTGSDFGNFSGFRRAGFSLYLSDDAGRWIIADLGSSNISLGNDNNRTGDPAMAMDLATNFRTVRLEAGPSGARLLVDGTQMLTLALGTGAAASASGWWGDGTILANATQTEVREVIYIPAPGALAVFALGGLAARRKRSRAIA